MPRFRGLVVMTADSSVSTRFVSAGRDPLADAIECAEDETSG
jgi:hypothetical protein